MFNLGAEKLLVIFFIALLVVGPDKLPELARKTGKALGDLRRMSGGFQDELRRALDEPLQTFTREFTKSSAPEEPAALDGVEVSAKAPAEEADTPAEPSLDDTDDPPARPASSLPAAGAHAAPPVLRAEVQPDPHRAPDLPSWVFGTGDRSDTPQFH